MITHRLQTRPAPEPPVRFYKTIALSFLVVTIILLGVVIFTTTKKATILIVAKEDIKTVNLVVGVEKQRQDSRALTGAVSSTIFHWAQTYYPANAKTVEDIAGGEIIIYNKSNTSQPLVKTTRFLTPGDILFRLSEGVTVPANGQITARVYADTPGAQGNVGPSQFTIPGLSKERQNFIYGESVKAMTGGIRQMKVLTEEDLKTAQMDYYEKVKQGFLSSAPEDIWLNQKIVLITTQNAAADQKAGDEVTEFKLSDKNTIVHISYNQEELSDVINKEIANKIDTTSEKVLSANKEPRVAVISYDARQGVAQLSVSQDVIVTLDANAEKLALTNFLGKKKDEIERYILGLSHVSSVETKFSPKWMRSAPSMPDRIKVIVKNIQ